MRFFKTLVALVFVLSGLVLGALNQQSVVIDLFFTQIQIHIGLAILLSVLAGAVIGGALVSISVVFKNYALKSTVKKASDINSIDQTSVEPRL